jgi:hypothetical protein
MAQDYSRLEKKLKLLSLLKIQGFSIAGKQKNDKEWTKWQTDSLEQPVKKGC